MKPGFSLNKIIVKIRNYAISNLDCTWLKISPTKRWLRFKSKFEFFIEILVNRLIVFKRIRPFLKNHKLF